MRKKLGLSIALSLIMVLAMSACSKNTAEETPNHMDETAETSGLSENQSGAKGDADAAQASLGEVDSGKVYEDNDLSYNVIGVRTNEYEDGTGYLIVKLEVYNHGSGDITFSPFDTLTLYGGKTEYPVDVMADVDAALQGTITPGNKIMGEAAFDITGSKDDDYVLYVGSGFEYSPAIKISADDIGKTFAEQFETSGIKSEYTIGVPVESGQLTVLLNSATLIPGDEAGRQILLLDLSVTNNEDDYLGFMLGLNFDGVYTSGGVPLESEVGEWTLPSQVEAHETAEGIVSFYIDEGTSDFYMTVTPDLNEMANKENIVFSVQ